MPLVAFKPRNAAAQSFDPFQNFRNEFDRLFDHLLPTLGTASPMDSGMVDFRVNVAETEKDIRITAEIPGISESEVDVQLTHDTLTIRGEKKATHEQKEENYHLVECRYGSFARALRLPFEPAADAVSASMKNGVLSITIAKPEKPKSESTKITVKAD